MNSNVIKQMRWMLSLKNLTIENSTNVDLINTLIKKLHPFSTDKSLIRFGPNGDGGYLIPDDFKGIEACFSPGVGNISAFEQDCLKYGMQVFLADKSVDSPAIKNDKLFFIKNFIGPLTGNDSITMDDWVNSCIKGNNSDLLLQMDIESDEYLTIIQMSENLLKRFRILVIEFHFLHKLWNKEFYKLASTTFQKILQYHTCVHIHPNNCCGVEKLHGIEIPRVAEFTFLRNDRINHKKLQTRFPHPLDFDNTSNNTIILPKRWYDAN